MFNHDEALFNYRLSRASRIIEYALGIIIKMERPQEKIKFILKNVYFFITWLPAELSTENSVSINRNGFCVEIIHQTKQSIRLETLSNNRPISVLLLDSHQTFTIEDLATQIKCKKRLDTRLKMYRIILNCFLVMLF
jgi:hypothetical protein